MKNKPQEIREIEELLGITLTEVETQEQLMDWKSRNSYLLNVHYEIIGLNLRNNEIQDFSFLEGLNHLQELNLSYNQIQDFSFLKRLNHLHTLDLSNIRIQRPRSFLLGRNHFQELNLEDNRIQDFSFLQELNNLKALHLRDNAIQDFSFLKVLSNLQKLDLSKNQIQDFSFLKGLSNLQKLDLIQNKIQDISFIKGLRNLQTLNLANNQIQDISFLQGISNLKELNLSNNKIEDISCLQALNQLQTLILWENKIQDISFLQSLSHLQRLDLDWNQIQDISFLRGLDTLKSLALSRNKIQDISFLQGLSNLQTLNLAKNQIEDISFLQGLSNLKELRLSSNKIQDYSFLQNLSHLETLDLSWNQIEDISFLQGLSNLQRLLLNHNKIQDISFLQTLGKLQSLNLSYNQIQDYSFLEKIKYLKCLYLENNQLYDISFLDGLSSLEELHLRNNKIQDISFLQGLSHLQTLNLNDNQIQDISLSFLKSLPKLKQLDLGNNPLPKIPKEILGKEYKTDLPALRTYLEDLEKGAEKNNEVKVILIGNGSVGKTQIAKRFVEGKDYVFDTQHHSTHGIVLMQRRIPCALLAEQGLVLNIWDFAGQDLYHATHRLFMRTQAVFVLVWDFENEYEQRQHIYNGKTYDNQNLCYWLEYARCFGENSPILVLQNKIDLGEKRMAKPHKQALQATYPIHDFLEVSAFSGKGFILLEEKIADIFEQNKEFADDLLKELPSSWVKVRNTVRDAQATGIKEIDFATFQASCSKQGIEKSAAVLLDFLHNTGVLYYKQEYFNGRIILNQAWAIEAIYQILDRDAPYFEVLEHQEGKISYKDLGKIWKKHSDSEKELFMDFMLSCELCFETTPHKRDDTPLSERTFIVPQLLSAVKPQEIEYFYEAKASEKMVLEYRFLPTIFIHRLIVKAHHLAEVAEMWQAGIVIKENADSFAIVTADYSTEPQSIIIQYTQQSKKLAEAIRETLREIEGEGEVKPQKPDIERPEILKGEAYLKSLKTSHLRLSISDIQGLIAQGKIENAIQAMMGTVADKEMLMLVSSQFYQLKKIQLEGRILHEHYEVALANITHSLLEILKEKEL